jgi:hypothetical protein
VSTYLVVIKDRWSGNWERRAVTTEAGQGPEHAAFETALHLTAHYELVRVEPADDPADMAASWQQHPGTGHREG